MSGFAQPLVALVRRHWYLPALAAAVAGGIGLPGPAAMLDRGGAGGRLAVALIFLTTGYCLPGERLRASVAQWRAHALLQGFIFVLTPLVALATLRPWAGALAPPLRAGMYALACLPTTIGTCVVFTQLAGGNAALALFNATLANVAGVVISPLLMTLMLGADVPLAATGLARIFHTLALTVLVPFAAGQCIRIADPRRNDRPLGRLTRINAILVLVILYFAVARSGPDVRAALGRPEMTLVIGYLAVFHLLLLALAAGLGRVARLPPGDRLALLFVGPQKTLALGAPLLLAYFHDHPEWAAQALLPLVFYHPWQLLVGSVLQHLATERQTRGGRP